MRAVLDTNVLLSGLVTGESAPSSIMASWRADGFQLMSSGHILDGVARALHKPYWRQRQDLAELSGRLAALRASVARVDPAEGIHGIADDDEDDLILATTVAAEAAFLVTGDKGLLALVEFRGIPIVSPREFLVRLAQADAIAEDETAG